MSSRRNSTTWHAAADRSTTAPIAVSARPGPTGTSSQVPSTPPPKMPGTVAAHRERAGRRGGAGHREGAVQQVVDRLREGGPAQQGPHAGHMHARRGGRP
ncbi:hypothetical protein GTY64_04385 [Streptomyces sp. SID8376]|uniref:hypothetical protein n=1 Tax=unclassified Streptomyces TaxID=2593676 RepID=UPI001319D938|nr:hypothetical protein [Streptomyces sp. SID8376]